MVRILLVAQDSEQQSAVAAAVRAQPDYDVVAVARSDQALREAATGKYDLALIQTDLPDGDGFEVCRRIRAGTDAGGLPVILLARPERQAENRQRGLDCGAADFIVQPSDALDAVDASDAMELLARINSTLRNKAHSDEAHRHNHELAEKVVERSRQLEWLAGELRIERDALRETFDVFQDGLLLLDVSGQVLIENTAGRLLLDQPAIPPQQRSVSESQEVYVGRRFSEVLADFAR